MNAHGIACGIVIALAAMPCIAAPPSSQPTTNRSSPSADEIAKATHDHRLLIGMTEAEVEKALPPKFAQLDSETSESDDGRKTLVFVRRLQDAHRQWYEDGRITTQFNDGKLIHFTKQG